MARLSSIAGVTAGAVALTSAAAALGARSLLNKVARNPDPVSREQLLARPDAEELSLTRPDGTVLQVKTAGSGPPVILAHGYTCAWWTWNLVWEKLIAQGHRVVAFDQRAHGDSTLGIDGIGSAQMAEDYAAILTHLDLRDAILVGHSMGVVMVGDADRTTPRSHAHRMAEGIPGARLVVVPEAGHLLNVEGAGPDTLVEVIESLS